MRPESLIDDANALHRRLINRLGNEFDGLDSATCVAACMMLAATVALHSGLPPSAFRHLAESIARQHEKYFLGDGHAKH